MMQPTRHQQSYPRGFNAPYDNFAAAEQTRLDSQTHASQRRNQPIQDPVDPVNSSKQCPTHGLSLNVIVIESGVLKLCPECYLARGSFSPAQCVLFCEAAKEFFMKFCTVLAKHFERYTTNPSSYITHSLSSSSSQSGLSQISNQQISKAIYDQSLAQITILNKNVGWIMPTSLIDLHNDSAFLGDLHRMATESASRSMEAFCTNIKERLIFETGKKIYKALSFNIKFNELLEIDNGKQAILRELDQEIVGQAAIRKFLKRQYVRSEGILTSVRSQGNIYSKQSTLLRRKELDRLQSQGATFSSRYNNPQNNNPVVFQQTRSMNGFDYQYQSQKKSMINTKQHQDSSYMSNQLSPAHSMVNLQPGQQYTRGRPRVLQYTSQRSIYEAGDTSHIRPLESRSFHQSNRNANMTKMPAKEQMKMLSNQKPSSMKKIAEMVAAKESSETLDLIAPRNEKGAAIIGPIQNNILVERELDSYPSFKAIKTERSKKSEQSLLKPDGNQSAYSAQLGIKASDLKLKPQGPITATDSNKEASNGDNNASPQAEQTVDFGAYQKLLKAYEALKEEHKSIQQRMSIQKQHNDRMSLQIDNRPAEKQAQKSSRSVTESITDVVFEVQTPGETRELPEDVLELQSLVRSLERQLKAALAPKSAAIDTINKYFELQANYDELKRQNRELREANSQLGSEMNDIKCQNVSASRRLIKLTQESQLAKRQVDILRDQCDKLKHGRVRDDKMQSIKYIVEDQDEDGAHRQQRQPCTTSFKKLNFSPQIMEGTVLAGTTMINTSQSIYIPTVHFMKAPEESVASSTNISSQHIQGSDSTESNIGEMQLPVTIGSGKQIQSTPSTKSIIMGTGWAASLAPINEEDTMYSATARSSESLGLEAKLSELLQCSGNQEDIISKIKSLVAGKNM